MRNRNDGIIGGQGRSSEEVKSSALIVVFLFTIFVVCALATFFIVT